MNYAYRAVTYDLDLSGLKITDADLDADFESPYSIGGFPQSRVRLNLARTQITDAGVATVLKKFKSLESLDVSDTAVTGATLIRPIARSECSWMGRK